MAQSKSKLGVFIVYALGQFGWSLTSFSVINNLAYFYMPPSEGTQSIFPSFIVQGGIIGTLTLIGLVGAGGRIFDAFTDPWIASMSDRSRSDLGRRRKYLLLAFIPFALLGALVFFPPTQGISSLNTIWVTVAVALFYLFMTMYVVPYTALIAELGHTDKERMTLSTLISVTWALGFAFGTQTIALQGAFEESGLSATAAFQRAVAIAAGVGGLLMGLSAFFLNERKYALPVSSSLSMRESIKTVLANKNFRFFAASDFFYWMALTFIQMGITYYVVELMERDKEYSSFFMLQLFGISFLAYLPILWITNKVGKNSMLKIAFVLFAVAFLMTGLLGTSVLPEFLIVAILLGTSAIAVAIFGILPNAIVGDMADHHSRKTGESLAGMYYGVRTLIMKAGIAMTNLIFPSFILAGTDGALRTSAYVAMAICIMGLLFFLKYREPESEGQAPEAELISDDAF